MENGVGIGVGEGVGIGVGAGVALCTGEGTKEFSTVCSEKAALVQPAARPASRKKEKQIADMFIHRVTAHFRQDLSKAYHGFPGKSNKAGGCGADGAGDSCNLTRLRVS